MDEDGNPSIEDIEKQVSETDSENSYLRQKNLSMQDAVESSFIPKADANVIEFKLSPEELLERIEHYLRGDVLKSRKNESQELETYFSPPTKKITVSLFKNIKSKIVYVIDEHSQENNNNNNKDDEDEEKDKNWEILSLIEGQGENTEEMIIEDNYKDFLLKELKRGLNAKKKTFVSEGYTTKEVTDNSRINLNEYGIAEIMNLLSMYINKETFLSFYKEERINEIMADIGDKLNEFLLINGKLMGLDTEYKKTKYPLMVITVLHTIENAYRRALLGNENRGTREGILITQHQPQHGINTMPMQTPKKKWSAFDRSTW